MIERDLNPEASYQELFQRAKSEFAMIMEDSTADDTGVKHVTINLFDSYVMFDQDDARKSFGVHFEREGKLNGDTYYTFDEDGKVYKTGWVGYGDDDYPFVIYANEDDEIREVDRKPSIAVSLEDLELLVDFIEHPLRNRQSFNYLKTFPDEQKMLQNS